ncbi:bifunctional 5,10-methylenetetrahydrofolate dehydrogenase/5,10-methenyltetrahydrofolate cyclohydrolase [Candidatus Odyssella acanthamoebae]|uniref:Bifunctional protein FolD n=1 Tax=Candidatus Odyssella acanthamoebae TaxID=91604 RepID=A0A077AYX4_9PROT|nr:bifunctional 5,10-methylenetetrahydrofolate dehydrogenase/5,10-methenyltetrahydrofolate cyclohydrolase [Candidatus Paracaedibacter acanthamoebae]AIK96833.1 5,10-methylene-tetrahydrofolate cyclohydrolase [Candidatus Paracaedibacter acanthamoebae]
MAVILDGKALAAQQKPSLMAKAHDLTLCLGRAPTLAVILVGEDPASQIYVGRKATMCKALGIHSIIHRLASSVTSADLIAVIEGLNDDETVDGILLQLPLPDHLDRYEALQHIDPAKDVDGLHPLNQGYLFQGKPTLVPCTPTGCLQLIKSCCEDLTGVNVTIIGTSVLVGRPLALLLMQQGATVTIANSKTRNLALVTQRSDIIVSATGRAHLITADHVKEGAIVIDVGIVKLNDRLIGDVDFAAVEKKAAFITPVPGGVGPMTIINLMANILKAAEERYHALQTLKNS